MPPKGIIILCIDSLRPDYLDFMPVTSKIANNGVKFEQAITQSPSSSTSTATILSGTYPFTHRVRAVHGPDISPHVTLITKHLKEMGYKTFFFSGTQLLFTTKLNNYSDHSYCGTGDNMLDCVLKTIEESSQNNEKFYIFYEDDCVHVPYTTDFELDVKKYDENIKKLYYNFDKNPEKIRKLFLERYPLAVKEADKYVSKIYNKLIELGIEKDVLLIIMSDHGESLGVRQLAHSENLYDNVLRVPLIISYKDIPRKLIKEQVRLMDLAPTILGILGRNDITMEGNNLLPYILNQKEIPNLDAYSETGFKRDVKDDIRKIYYQSIRSEDWKLIHSPIYGTWELYDLKKDPNEENNLHGSNENVEKELKNKLLNVLSLEPKVGLVRKLHEKYYFNRVYLRIRGDYQKFIKEVEHGPFYTRSNDL